MDVELMGRVWVFFAQASVTTIGISLAAILLGLCLGLTAALASVARTALLRWPARAYVSVFRGTPALIQLFLFYFGGLQLGLEMTAITAGIVALGVNIGAYMTESIRGAIVAVDRGQAEAARSLGLGRAQTMARVILPQAARLMVRPLGVNSVALIKGSAIVSTISVTELTFTAHRFISSTFKPFEMFILAAIFYLAIVSAVLWLVAFIDRRVALED